jgi:hypothetical protein
VCVIYVTGATRSISRTNSKGRCNHVESPPPSCSVSQSVLPDDFQKSLRLRSKLAPQLLPVFVNQSLSGQRTSPKPCPAIDRCGTLSAVGISLADIAPPLLPWCSESGRWAASRSSASPAVATSSLRGSRFLRCVSGVPPVLHGHRSSRRFPPTSSCPPPARHSFAPAWLGGVSAHTCCLSAGWNGHPPTPALLVLLFGFSGSWASW